MSELEKLLAEAQTDEPWTVVWYGDEHLPAIAIHRSAEDRVCFMPTIQHPADGVQAEANAALICAAVNALPELLAMAEENARLRAALQAIVDNAEIGEREADAAFARAALSKTGAA
jgi:hypothetical protein